MVHRRDPARSCNVQFLGMKPRVITALSQVCAYPVAAEMARAAAVLVALAESTSIATTIERPVIPEAVVGAVDSLPGRPRPASTRHDGVMKTLVRVITGPPEG